MAEPQDQQVVELINAIDSKLAKVHTQSLDLSFNEILDMYRMDYKEFLPTSTCVESSKLRTLIRRYKKARNLSW